MDFFWIIVGITLAAQCAHIAQSFRGAYVEKRLARLATAIGLAVPAELETGVLEQTARRLRAQAIGGAIGLTFAALVLAPSPGSTLAVVLVALSGTLIGSTLGTAVVSILTIRHDDAGDIRIARARVITIDDYFQPWLRRSIGIVIALSIIGVAAYLVFGRDLTVVPVILVASAIVTFIVAEAASRKLLPTPQPAASMAELAWSDALRATLIDDLYSAPLSMIVSALAFASIESFEGGATIIIGFGTAAAVGGALIYSSVARPRQHVLRRLWPEVVEAGKR